MAKKKIEDDVFKAVLKGKLIVIMHGGKWMKPATLETIGTKMIS